MFKVKFLLLLQIVKLGAADRCKPEDYFLGKITKKIGILSHHLNDLRIQQLGAINDAFLDPSRAESFFVQQWEYISFGKDEARILSDFASMDDICTQDDTVLVSHDGQSELEDSDERILFVSAHVPETKKSIVEIKKHIDLIADKRFELTTNIPKLGELRAECIRQKELLMEIKDNTCIFCQMCKPDEQDAQLLQREQEETYATNFSQFPEINIYDIYGFLGGVNSESSIDEIKASISRLENARLKRQLEFVFRYEIGKIRYNNFLKRAPSNFKVPQNLVFQAFARAGEYTLIAQELEDVQSNIKRIIDKQMLLDALKARNFKEAQGRAEGGDAKAVLSKAKDVVTKFFK